MKRKTKTQRTKIYGMQKTVLKRKFIAINTFKKSQINTETLLFKELEKKSKLNPQLAKEKKLIKFKAEINKI